MFNTAADFCELYGHDLVTGAEISPQQYRARDPKGRAVIKPADYVPPPEEPDAAYPFWLTTGRLVYHWHSRTKTGRVPALQEAAPVAVAEINHDDAKRLGVGEGELVRVRSRRGMVEVRARLTDIAPGHVFIPFHYGRARFGHGEDAAAVEPTAANELTLTDWDPVSKQPQFKFAAVCIEKA